LGIRNIKVVEAHVSLTEETSVPAMRITSDENTGLNPNASNLICWSVPGRECSFLNAVGAASGISPGAFGVYALLPDGHGSSRLNS
tara:strand:- start:209 stop:466 length:258 start_codon:yes stop_codon:yes gene_type:complete